MHENFIALEKEKRDRIINAAIHEFSVKGFKNASTNEIVKNAGISKGALFHYFPTKLELFKFMFRYSTDFFFNSMMPHIKELPPDVFERWVEITRRKFGIIGQYPNIVEFLMMTYNENAPEMSGFLRSEFERVSREFLAALYEGIDLSLFRADVDVNKALKIIWWVLEGFSLEKQRTMKIPDIVDMDGVFDSLIDEMESYLIVLKKSFYNRLN